MYHIHYDRILLIFDDFDDVDDFDDFDDFNDFDVFVEFDDFMITNNLTTLGGLFNSDYSTPK